MILKKMLFVLIGHLLPSEDEDYKSDPESYYYLYGETILPSEWDITEENACMRKNVHIKHKIDNYEITPTIENYPQ